MKYFLILLALITLSAHADEWQTVDGIKYHSSCLNNFGADFPAFFRGGIQKGLTCLENLRSEGSDKNLKLISDALSQNNLSIACHEKNYHWDHAIAHASVNESRNHPEIGLFHPYISIDPSATFANNKPEFMSQVVFHEMFHNIGYLHGETVDYAYACEECCFAEGDKKEAACRICKDEFSGVGDEAYVKSLVKYYDLTTWSRGLMIQNVLRRSVMNNNQSVLNKEYLLDFDGMSALTYVSARRWNDHNDGSYLLSILQWGLTENEKSFEAMAEQALEAREALFSKSFTEAATLFSDLNLSSLKGYFATDFQRANRMWNAVLYDMDVLFVEAEKAEVSEDLLNRLQENYHKILSLKPAN